ncbi:hypothetical protein [Actinomadura fibrosa]|uniref:ATP-binding protein n=1 Tax=Actinomadura fibrosa TaxID=111802 RepID=A0ABW2XXS6_9ACTN|nr:hypothetical protein [Actinomadura fibrosa]
MHATGALVTNAVQHAHTGDPQETTEPAGTVRVLAELDAALTLHLTGMTVARIWRGGGGRTGFRSGGSADC